MVTVSMNANVGSGAVWVQVWLRVVCVNMSIGEYFCVYVYVWYVLARECGVWARLWWWVCERVQVRSSAYL